MVFDDYDLKGWMLILTGAFPFDLAEPCLCMLLKLCKPVGAPISGDFIRARNGQERITRIVFRIAVVTEVGGFHR